MKIMNKLILALSALAVLVGGFFVFNSYIYHEKQADEPVFDEPINDDGANQADDNEVNLPSINVTTPTPGHSVSSPIEVAGEAQGHWFFEATAPVVVVNWDGLIIGEGYIEAQGEWMTEEMVPFTGSISYELPADSYSNRGTLILQRANASGLPQFDVAIEVPVNLTESVSDNLGEVTVCTEEMKQAEFCTREFAPVCGLVQVQCFTTPCDPIPETFSNSCNACSQGNVVSYTEGACKV